MNEQTQPNIFHIHIDATHFPAKFEKFAREHLGFLDTDFSGHPDGYPHFEPNRHLTLKIATKQQFADTWAKLESKADECLDFVGYLEGEYIPEDEVIPYRPFQDSPVPFKITRRTLSGSAEEQFRQTELHLTFDKDKSSKAQIGRLLESGLYGAFIPKRHGEFLVLTAQGFVRDIVPLYKRLREYLLKTGGVYSCTLKEERAIKFKLYGIKPSALPEVIGEIDYLGN
jgi:hypothetical protein